MTEMKKENKKMKNLCNRCLNDCKSIRSISTCRNYNNPARRQFDWRCRICNKRVPAMHRLCLEHEAWLLLIQKLFGIGGMMGIIPKFREIIRKKEEIKNE